jgi:hypothetical protein
MLEGVQSLRVDLKANERLQLKYASATLQSQMNDENLYGVLLEGSSVVKHQQQQYATGVKFGIKLELDMDHPHYLFNQISRKRAEFVLAQFLLQQEQLYNNPNAEAFLVRSKDDADKIFAISLTYQGRFLHHNLSRGVMCWYLNNDELPCG